jgi:hypothetical protein
VSSVIFNYPTTTQTAFTRSGNLSLEVPEEGMDFMANMPEPDNPVVTRPAAHRGLKPGVARTYSRISSPDRPNQTSFSSQPTLVDLSQRAGPSQSRGSDDERPHPSGLVPQRSRRPITDNSVRSEQDDVDALSSPEGSPWPTVHDIDKVRLVRFGRDCDAMSPLTGPWVR